MKSILALCLVGGKTPNAAPQVLSQIGGTIAKLIASHEGVNMDLQQFRERLHADGYEVLEREMPPAKFVDTHSHPFDVQAIVTEGEITLTCEGATKTYVPGDLFTMAAGMNHTEQYGPSGVKYVLGRRHRGD
jgi:quercetin dioxygenase-like cupin family protein